MYIKKVIINNSVDGNQHNISIKIKTKIQAESSRNSKMRSMDPYMEILVFTRTKVT